MGEFVEIEYDDKLCNQNKIKSAIKMLDTAHKVLMTIILWEFL